MIKDEFWQHIQATRRRDPEEHAERLSARLGRLPVPEILSFGQWWHRMHIRAYSWKLWGAAYLINGGCSEDGFSDFRDWLILQGREVYEAALRRPDSLAEYLRGDAEVEAMCNPAYDAYSAVTGRDDYVDALQQRYPRLPDFPVLERAWNFDDEAAMRRRYPRLFASYVEGHGHG